jgi:hypothetical protein
MTEQLDPESQRRQVIRQRNIATGLVLTGLVVLFFFITIAKMHG